MIDIAYDLTKKVNYFRTWFFLDLIAALPFDVLHAFSDLMVSQQYISEKRNNVVSSVTALTGPAIMLPLVAVLV